MFIYLSLLVALVGLIIYVVSQNGKVAELGRIMFAFGLLSWLLSNGGQRIP